MDTDQLPVDLDVHCFQNETYPGKHAQIHKVFYEGVQL